ncbi:MAG: radical SAM protein [Bacteroidota bacterium]|nr:radical SAM protein [Bacteroidota bacterium]
MHSIHQNQIQSIASGSKSHQLSVDKADVEQISELLRNQYRIIDISDTHYRLKKEFENLKTLRISLTEKCNYRCFFCHEEGLDMKAGWKSKSEAEVYALILRAIARGYNDITFTGGEPLIKYKEIINILNRLNQEHFQPDISITTNAQLINDDIVKAVEAYKGKVKFNVSLHHTNPEKYLKITNPKRQDKEHFEKIKQNIRLLTENEIFTKLNFVVLKGLNTDIEDLHDIIDTAVKLNVKTIKFLELLITNKLIKFYKYHYTLDAIISTLKDELRFVSENLRTSYYEHIPTGLIVEFSHVSCSMGCDKCVLNSELILTSELKFHPCFFHSEKGLDMSTDDAFDKNYQLGNQHRIDYGKKYGNKTPFIVNERGSLTSKTEYQYITDDFERFEAYLLGNCSHFKIK